MDILSIFLIGVGLSMDAFAVAIGKGLSLKKLTVKDSLTVGLWFGGFQALMPSIGYFLGSRFADRIESIDHWIAFVLLTLIGIQMLREAISEKEDEEIVAGSASSLKFKEMLLLAIATSIDALAVGVSFAFLSVHIVSAAGLIGCTTFVISIIGLRIGHFFGVRYRKKAQIAGGVILILIGLRILVEHLFLG